MSHVVGKSAFKSLEERINRFPMGAPPSDTLYKILKILYSEKEAALVALLPIKPFTTKTASKIWKTDEVCAQKTLQELSKRALLLDIDHNGVQKYIMPPPMAGFFEFALMRTRNDIDQKVLSELFYQYLNVEDDFIKDLFLGTETRFGRVFVSEESLSQENTLHILDFERASHLIKNSKSIALSTCYCRHKAYHLGKNCSAPIETCLTFDNTASSLIKHNYAKKIDISECLEILHMSYEANLVQCGENVSEDITFLCNCCGCCCEGLKAVKKFGSLHPIETTNFLPKIDNEKCIACGKCLRACPIGVIDMDTKTISINEDICLGCGLCVRNCPQKALGLKTRNNKIITPLNTVHRTVLQAIEKGTLQDLIFDNRVFASHRAMASVLSVILKLPPLKQVLASKQMKSIYLERLLDENKKKYNER